jgi:dolichol-phosphate mannosyltransferase
MSESSMSTTPYLSILIPCFNESENVHRLSDQLLPILNDLSANGPIELIFIDDGSTDTTWNRLLQTFDGHGNDKYSIQFERHSRNLGLGAALRTGLSVARGSIIVTTDSDGTYDFSEIPKIISWLQDDVAIVIASPYHAQGSVQGVPKSRLLLSRGSSFLYRLLVSWDLHTYTSLFRAYRREVLEQVSFSAQDYLAGTEILVKSYFLGYRIVEYPTVLKVRRYGTSKARIIQTIAAHLLFQTEIVAHRLGIHSLIELKG